jgi:hypothetical protein
VKANDISPLQEANEVKFCCDEREISLKEHKDEEGQEDRRDKD